VKLEGEKRELEEKIRRREAAKAAAKVSAFVFP
jgi:hypothetical protein